MQVVDGLQQVRFPVTVEADDGHAARRQREIETGDITEVTDGKRNDRHTISRTRAYDLVERARRPRLRVRGRRHRPINRGARFSRNADIPSAISLVPERMAK